MLWLIDTIVSSDHLPVCWSKLGKQDWDAQRFDAKVTLNKLSSAERLRFISFGEVPRYMNNLLHLSSEQHPMVSAVKSYESVLTVGQTTNSDIRSRAEAFR